MNSYDLQPTTEHEPFILGIPGFAKSVIRSMVERVLESERGKQKLVPLMLPPHPAHYSFPEVNDIMTSPDGSGHGLSVMKLKL